MSYHFDPGISEHNQMVGDLANEFADELAAFVKAHPMGHGSRITVRFVSWPDQRLHVGTFWISYGGTMQTHWENTMDPQSLLDRITG